MLLTHVLTDPVVSRGTSDMEAITGTRRSRGYHSLEIAGDAETKGGRRAWMRWAAPAACVLCVPLLLLLVGDHWRPSFDWFQGATHPKGNPRALHVIYGISDPKQMPINKYLEG